MAKSPYLKLIDLRGGINDSDAPFAIEDNEVVSALNVDYRSGNIGTKRGGLTGLSLAGSVFERMVPTINGTTSGASAGTATPSIVMPAASSLTATNLMLIVFVTTDGVITVANYRGVGMSLIQTVTSGGGVTVASYRVSTPNVAGGTVAITTAAIANTTIVGMFVDHVDQAGSPFGLSTGAAVAAGATVTSAAFTSKALVLCGITAVATITQNLFGVGTIQHGTDLTPGPPVHFDYEAKLGMNPTTQFSFSFAAGAYATNVFGLLGVAAAAGVAVGNEPLRAVMRHSKDNTIANDELWIQDDWGRLDRRVSGTWQGGVPVQNWQVGSGLSGLLDASYTTNGVSLHEKFFLALDGVLYQNRLHVWDGTVLRWAGFATPSAPTGANTGGAGTFTGTRYYRMRYIQKSGTGVILRRSEPSAQLIFIPSGANTGVVVTKPAAGGFVFGEGETDWELEASLDGVTFYLLATTVVGTATVTDTTPVTTGYSAGTIAPALTEYTPPTAPRHVVVDGDRLLFGGSPQGLLAGTALYTYADDSRITWTPLRADLGAGNDERVPATSRFFQDVDGVNGGRVTHLLPMSLGGIFVMKESRIYKMNRQGTTPAYDWTMYTDARGCAMRAGVNGTDQQGNPATYFVDLNAGVCRMENSGIKDLMQKRLSMTARINRNARLVARVLYYPKNWQVWVSVALDTQPQPSYLWCYNMRTESWTDYDGNASSIVSWVLFPDPITLAQRPYVVPVVVGTYQLVEADLGTSDDGVYYRGTVVSKAFTPSELFAQFTVDAAVVHAELGTALIELTAIRDLGLQTKAAVPQVLSGGGAQTYVTKAFDDLVLGDCSQVQFQIGDPAAMGGSQLAQTWTLEAIVARILSAGEVN